VDKNRVASACTPSRRWCDRLLLDDGINSEVKAPAGNRARGPQAPFGNEYLLPRGTLREPPGNLRRASYVFITKSTLRGTRN